MPPPPVELLPCAANRILLRRFTTGDLPAFQAYRRDPELGRYQGWVPLPDAEAARFLDAMRAAPLLQPGSWCQIAIACRSSNELLGDLGLRVRADSRQAEIGFTVRRGSQRQGIGSEAVRTALALLFQHTPIRCAAGVTDARNTASIRLLEKVGMKQVASRETVFRGESCTEHLYLLGRDPGQTPWPIEWPPVD